jgi:hypothetical protein
MSNAKDNQSKLTDLPILLSPSGGNDSTALQALANACAASGEPMVVQPGTYTLGATLVLNCIGDLSACTFNVASSTVTPAIRVGVTTSGPTQLNGILRLPKLVNTTKPTTGWAGQGVGIEFADLYQSEVYVPLVQGFAVGVTCGGYSSGFAYNTVRIGMLATNGIGLRLKAGAATGWVNQNTFIGGRIFIPSSEGAAIAGTRYLQMLPFNVATSGST